MTTDASSPSSPSSRPGRAGRAGPDGDDPARLLGEQEALRRVATLVAQGVPADELFAAVTMEVGRLLAVDSALLVQLEADGLARLVGGWAAGSVSLPVGERLPLGGDNLVTRVSRTGRAARSDDYMTASGPLGLEGRERGTRSGVATPVMVEGRLWGTMIASTITEAALPADTEARLASFTELVATAIANADSRAALADSRARILFAFDDARRRIERDLHDGAQQRLVSLALELRAAEATVDAETTPEQLRDLLSHLANEIAAIQTELREIARGIHPAILTEGGLTAALRTLARRSPIPVELDVAPHPRLPEPIEVTAYYVVSEALTNAAKHGNPSVVRIEVALRGDVLSVRVADDGPGGADPGRGSGLLGLRDRVEAVAGRLALLSRPGEGTTVTVELPAGL